MHVTDGLGDDIQAALSCGFGTRKLSLPRLLLLGLDGEVLHPALCVLQFAFHFENIGLGVDCVGGEILTCIPDFAFDASLACLKDFISPSILLLLSSQHEAMLSYIKLSCQLLQLAVLVKYFVGYRLEITIVFGFSG